MHNWSIPSPTPSFFSITTILKVYGLLDSSIIPFWSIIWTYSSIHSCSFSNQWPCFPTTRVLSKSLIACFIVRQFPMSWAFQETMLSYSSKIVLKAFLTSVPSVLIISKSLTSLSSFRWSIHCLLSYVLWHNHPTELSSIWIPSFNDPSFSISSHSLTASSELLLCST